MAVFFVIAVLWLAPLVWLSREADRAIAEVRQAERWDAPPALPQSVSPEPDSALTDATSPVALAAE
jgi:hypothetical protein